MMIYLYCFRFITVFATLGVTTFDFFQKLTSLSEKWPFASWLTFSILLDIVALTCGALTTHALLSLWRGTSFWKDLVDYEPNQAIMN
jgi:hypothetical protein